MPEIARDACLYFDPSDPMSIAASIDEARRDPEATRQRCERGLQYAASYSWQQTARRTFALLAAAAATSN